VPETASTRPEFQFPATTLPSLAPRRVRSETGSRHQPQTRCITRLNVGAGRGPDYWFEQGLAYATGKLYGAAEALSPAAAGMGQVADYIPADYLVQHASRKRRYVRVSASTWEAHISHLRDPADTARLANSAENRLLYCYAISLYRQPPQAERGDEDSARVPGRDVG
jgi:hypothetical protein